MTRLDHIKRPLLFFIACMALCALVWLNTSSYKDANYYSSGIVLEGGGPGNAYPPDWDSSTEPLSAAQMDSVLEVVGHTRLCASARSAAAQAQIETSPAALEAAGLAGQYSHSPLTDLCHVSAVVVILYYRRARSRLYRTWAAPSWSCVAVNTA